MAPGKFIGYTDGTFSIVEANDDGYGCVYLGQPQFEIDDSEHAAGAITLGLLDKQVYLEYVKAESDARRAQQEGYRRQQYESLKAEFGDL